MTKKTKQVYLRLYREAQTEFRKARLLLYLDRVNSTVSVRTVERLAVAARVALNAQGVCRSEGLL